LLFLVRYIESGKQKTERNKTITSPLEEFKRKKEKEIPPERSKLQIGIP